MLGTASQCALEEREPCAYICARSLDEASSSVDGLFTREAEPALKCVRASHDAERFCGFDDELAATIVYRSRLERDRVGPEHRQFADRRMPKRAARWASPKFEEPLQKNTDD